MTDCVRPPACSLMVLLGGLLLAGCGGNADPFDRQAVSGRVTLDGEPLKYGEIYFRGEPVENSVEIAQATLMIRNGEFKSNRAATPGRGKNTVLVIAYDGDPPPPPDPNSESDTTTADPKVVGYYSTELTLDNSEPLAIDIKKADLKRQPPL